MRIGTNEQGLFGAWRRLVRFGFYLLYNEMAWSYDWVSWAVSLGEWSKWVRVPLRYVNGRFPQTILEIGHGPGHLLAELAQTPHCAIGLDLSPFMGRQAKRRLEKAGCEPKLVRGNVQRLPFAPQTVDLVFSTFPTDYIIDPATLTAVYRVLKENGRFVIVPEGHLTQGGIGQRLVDWLFRITGQRTKGAVAQLATDHTIWTPVVAQFEQAGLHATIEIAQFPKSEATVIIATKADKLKAKRAES